MRLFFLAAFVCVAGCVPKRVVTVDEIPKLTKLTDVMDAQATVADPQFKKIGTATYSDDDYAQFADAAERLKATSLKIKDFSKGPEFDALAMTLHDKATALGTAAQAKDAAASSTALKEMKATCKTCHSKFK